MIALDTNVLAVFYLYRRDPRITAAEALMHKLISSAEKKVVGIYNLFELCGLLCTFDKGDVAKEIFKEYQESRVFRIIYPTFWKRSKKAFWTHHDENLMRNLQKKMRLGDAAILWVLEENKVDKFITWNKRHFEGKTNILVQTPEEFLGGFNGAKNPSLNSQTGSGRS